MLENARRACAQWHVMFEFDAPACLKLRPIVSCSHPLRKARRQPDAILDAELRMVDRKLAELPTDINPVSDLLNTRPEYLAFVVGSRLYERGFHECFMANSEKWFAQIVLRGLDDAHELDPERNALLGYFSKSFHRFKAPERIKASAFTCFFATRPGPDFRVTGYGAVPFRFLPQPVRERWFEFDVEHNPDPDNPVSEQSRFIRIDVEAVDPNRAVEQAIENLRKIRLQRAVGLTCDVHPYRDLHETVVIQNNGNLIAFNWKQFRRSYRGLPSITDFDVARESFVREDELSRLISCFSNCQHLFEEGTDEDVFYNATRGLDLMFGDATDIYRSMYEERPHGRPRRISQSRIFIDLGARLLAMFALPDVFEGALNDRKSNARKISLGDLRRRPAPQLYDALIDVLKVDHVGYRSLNRFRFVSRNLSTLAAFRRRYLVDYYRYYFDLNHLRMLRNDMVHENKTGCMSYYVSIVMQLMRNVIAFRVACVAALPKLSSQALWALDETARRTDHPIENVVFAAALGALVRDSQALLGQSERPFWLSTGTVPKLHSSGWGSWQLGRLHETLSRDPSFLRNVDRFSWNPLASLRLAENLELL